MVASLTEGYHGIRECTKVCPQNDLSCMGYGLPGVNWHLFLTNIRGKESGDETLLIISDT